MATLVVQVDGQQQQHELKAGRNTIGRHPDCDIGILQPSVSGRHAVLIWEDEQCFVEDTGSRNGTFLNQQRVTQRAKLANNDLLQFGDASARIELPGESDSSSFVQAASPANQLGFPSSGSVQVADQPATVTSEIRSGRFDGLDVNPGSKLKAVLEISNRLAGTVNLAEMLPKILDTLFEIFTYADRGCIMLRDEKTGAMVPRAMKQRRAGDDATVRLSRTVVNKVLEEKTGILSADASTDSAFNGSESIADLRIRSMMCVPLLGMNDEANGILSIDSQNPLGQFTPDDLQLLMAVANQAALSYETARLMVTYAEKKKQDNELKIAEQVQQALLPTEMPQVAGYDFYASYDAAQAVGGDYYDWFDLGEGKICLSFGDVAGKGVPGALIMSRMASCVQSTLRHVQDVVGAMQAINDHMCDTSVEGRFVTYLLAVVDTSRHTMELANAGHMSPIIRHADGSVELFNDDIVGTPIGVLEDYPYASESRELAAGDVIIFVTDGVDEAMNPAGEFYTGERLIEFVKNGPTQAAELGRSVLSDVRRHAAGQAQNDDITIMTFGRNQ